MSQRETMSEAVGPLSGQRSAGLLILDLPDSGHNEQLEEWANQITTHSTSPLVVNRPDGTCDVTAKRLTAGTAAALIDYLNQRFDE